MLRSILSVATLVLLVGCMTPQGENIMNVRSYAGKGVSQGEKSKGYTVSTSCTVVEYADRYEGNFIFYSGKDSILLKGLVSKKLKNAQRTYTGVSKDPRGFDVNWKVSFTDDGLTGTYHNPHDHGTFSLKLVSSWK